MGQAIGPERLAVGRARIARAQAAMKGAGFDALLLVNSLNLVYLAGY